MENLSKRSIHVEITKPRSLIGGSDVYQKKELPYWFCKIKGREEFMCLYVEDLSIEDLLYDKDTGKERHFYTICEKDLKIQVEKALENKPKEGYIWIPVYYPSFNENNELEFVSRQCSDQSHNGPDWEKIAKMYLPKNFSELLSADDYFLLQLRWLKDGIIQFKDLIFNPIDVSLFDNINDYISALEEFEAKQFGGVHWFLNQKPKIVKDTSAKLGFSRVGVINNRFGVIYKMDDNKDQDILDSHFVYDIALVKLRG